MYAVLRWLDAERPDIYREVGSEQELGALIVEVLADRPLEDGHALADRLMREAALEPDFLVSIGLANLATPAAVIPVDRRAVLTPVPTMDRSWHHHERDIRAVLGDAITPAGRHSHGTTEGQMMDSRIGAALQFRERGPLRLARRRAETKARYAIAGWCLLKPPDAKGHDFVLWPSVGSWIAKPAVSIEHAARPVAEGAARSIGTRNNGGEFQYADYELPNSKRALASPFKAMAKADQRHSARCLLSAAWALWVGVHIPGELQRADRLLHLSAAIDALCAAPPGVRGSSTARWERLCEKLGVWAKLSRMGFAVDGYERAEERLGMARNLVAHSSEAYGLNLDGRVSSHRLGDISPHELSPALVASDLSLFATAVGHAVQRMWRLAERCRFDDATYEQQFAASTP